MSVPVTWRNLWMTRKAVVMAEQLVGWYNAAMAGASTGNVGGI
jgi:hypothetical protein